MRVLSLFSGAGGLDVGFHIAGCEIVGCVEINTPACQTLERNRAIGTYISPDCHIFNQDIADFDATALGTEPIDLVIGGPPCQPYSASGRRIGGAPGIESVDGQLFEHYCAILARVQPRGFLFENVRGLLGVNSGQAWQTILGAFADLGYTLSYRLLDAAAYGVPQHRERVILVGLRHDQPFLFPLPTHGPDSPDNRPYISAGEALADLQSDSEPYHSYDGKYGHLLTNIPEGMNYSFYTMEMGHTAPVFAWRSKFSSFLYKIAQDRPTKTLQAQLGKFAGPFHWKNRRLTIDELKRIQSFPDDYVFAGSYGQVSEQIGNAVPPRLATALAQAVVQQLGDATTYPDLRLMSPDFVQTFDARKGATARKTRAVTQRTHAAQINDTSISSPRPVAPRSTFCLTYNGNIKTHGTEQTQAYRVDVVQDRVESSKLCVTVCDQTETAAQQWHLIVDLHVPLLDGTQRIEISVGATNFRSIVATWDALEEVITQRSAYMSLVGLYGHFAEPHPKFAATLIHNDNATSSLTRLILFFSTFAHCGRNIAGSVLAQNIGVPERDIPLLARQLRDLRYDIRSHRTSARIPADTYFCAYPFPELSAAYQVNRAV